MKYILSDLKTNEISLVDEGAIKKKFIIYKNKNGNSKFKEEIKPMKIEEAIALGLIDEEEANRIGKKNDSKDDKDKDSSVIKELLASVSKMLSTKVKKDDEKKEGEGDKGDAKGDNKGDDKGDAGDKSGEEVEKLKEQMTSLTKEMEKSKKGLDLIAKLSSTEDPKEWLKIMKEIREFANGEPEKVDKDTVLVKALEGITKRLEKIELKSKGVDGQESTEQKKSEWGGFFR